MTWWNCYSADKFVFSLLAKGWQPFQNDYNHEAEGLWDKRALKQTPLFNQIKVGYKEGVQLYWTPDLFSPLTCFLSFSRCHHRYRIAFQKTILEWKEGKVYCLADGMAFVPFAWVTLVKAAIRLFATKDEMIYIGIIKLSTFRVILDINLSNREKNLATQL